MARLDPPPRLEDVGGEAWVVACWWARRKWPVIPVAAAMKAGRWVKSIPLPTPERGGPVPPDAITGLRRGGADSGGFHQATCDEGLLRRYFPPGCDHLIGTPGRLDVVILDWDQPDGEERWLAANPDLAGDYRYFRERTFVVGTRADDPGRVHVYARLPGGMQAPMRAGSDQYAETNARNCGLDIKSGTSSYGLIEGFVVLPGSGPRPDGHGEYTVVCGHPDEICEIPVSVYRHLTVPDGGATVEKDEATGEVTRRTVSLRPSAMSRGDRLPNRPRTPGQRYEALRNIGHDRRWRSLEDALLYAEAFNNRYCEPPHEAAEVERAVGEGWKWRLKDEEREAAEEAEKAAAKRAEAEEGERLAKEAEKANPPPPETPITSAVVTGPRGAERAELEDTPDGFRAALKALDVGLRRNVRADVQIRMNGGGWVDVDRDQLAQLSSKIAQVYTWPGSTQRAWILGAKREALVRNEAAKTRCDPFLDYLQGLTWDTARRIDRLLERAFVFHDDTQTPLVRWASSSTLIAAAARAAEPGTPFPRMVILTTCNSLDHQRYWRLLLPEPGQFTSRLSLLGPRDEARKRQLIGPVVADCIGLHDPSGAGGVIRAFVTQDSDVIDEASDRRRWEPRRAILVASSADEKAVPDQFEVEETCVPLAVESSRDMAFLAEERDQIWAEAYARRGEVGELAAGSGSLPVLVRAASEEAMAVADNTMEMVAGWAERYPARAATTDTILQESGAKHHYEGRTPRRLSNMVGACVAGGQFGVAAGSGDDRRPADAGVAGAGVHDDERGGSVGLPPAAVGVAGAAAAGTGAGVGGRRA